MVLCNSSFRFACREIDATARCPSDMLLDGLEVLEEKRRLVCVSSASPIPGAGWKKCFPEPSTFHTIDDRILMRVIITFRTIVYLNLLTHVTSKLKYIYEGLDLTADPRYMENDVH